MCHPIYSGFHFFYAKLCLSKVLRADGRLVNMSGVFCTNNAQAPSLFSNVTLLLVLRWKRGRELVHCLYKKLQTLFDFIKSCGGRIDLKFSGVALLGLLYSPKWKSTFLYGRLFTSSCSRIIQCERNIPLERGSLRLFYEKNYRA